MVNTHTPKITVIDPIIQTSHEESTTEVRKLRVAAYARVSTEQDEQQNSYATQVRYYTNYIQGNPDWEFVQVYSDEGISGTSMKKRDGFNQMIADAEAGMIDTILVKSISRFARNTVDALVTVRKLKAIGVEVIFEKENLHSMSTQGEVLLTMLSSLAQEESHNISENVRWGKQKNMMDGKVTLAYSHFLGYKKGKDGILEIIPEEAEVIREIYDLYLKDMTIRNIAKRLTAEGHKTPTGKSVWHTSTVRSILSNEKYRGDARLQKSYVADFLTKQVKQNNGERKQYYIKDSHPAIIEPDIFDLVQTKLEENGKNSRKISNNSPFTTKIVCGDCGGFFGRKIYHSNDKYRTVAWCCNQKYHDNFVCNTPRIREEELKKAFMEALGLAIAHTSANVATSTLDGLKADAEAIRLKEAQKRALGALDKAVLELRELIADNAHRSQDQTIFRKRYDVLKQKVDDHKEAVKLADEAIINHTAKKAKLRRFKSATEIFAEETAYSDELVTDTLDRIVVSKAVNGCYSLEFTFVNETKITIEIGGKSKCAV